VSPGTICIFSILNSIISYTNHLLLYLSLYIGSYDFCALYVRSTLLRHNSGVSWRCPFPLFTLLSRPGRGLCRSGGEAEIRVTTPAAEGGRRDEGRLWIIILIETPGQKKTFIIRKYWYWLEGPFLSFFFPLPLPLHFISILVFFF